VLPKSVQCRYSTELSGPELRWS